MKNLVNNFTGIGGLFVAAASVGLLYFQSQRDLTFSMEGPVIVNQSISFDTRVQNRSGNSPEKNVFLHIPHSSISNPDHTIHLEFDSEAGNRGFQVSTIETTISLGDLRPGESTRVKGKIIYAGEGKISYGELSVKSDDRIAVLETGKIPPSWISLAIFGVMAVSFGAMLGLYVSRDQKEQSEFYLEKAERVFRALETKLNQGQK